MTQIHQQILQLAGIPLQDTVQLYTYVAGCVDLQ